MSKRKLLLADDSITIQKVVNLTFADEGIEVISVGDGDSAMRKFDEFMPDLVMADVNMPGLSGYEVCRIIKCTEETQNIPVILLVGSFEPFDEAQAKDAGADDFLTKPFQSIRQLVNKVTDLLNQRERAEADGEAAPQSAPHAGNFDDTLEFEKQSETTTEWERPSHTGDSFTLHDQPPAETATDFRQERSNGFGQSESAANFESRQAISSEFGDAGMDDEMIEASPANDYISGFDQGYQREATGDYAKTQPFSAEDFSNFDHRARENADQTALQSAADENQAYFGEKTETNEPPSFDEEARKLGFAQNYEDAERRSEVISETEPDIDYYLPAEQEFEKEVSDAETLGPEVPYAPDEEPREADLSQAPEEDQSQSDPAVEDASETRGETPERETSLAEETRLREATDGAEAMPEAEIDLSYVGSTDAERGAEWESAPDSSETAEFIEARELKPETEDLSAGEAQTEQAAEEKAGTEHVAQEASKNEPQIETISETPIAAVSQSAPVLDFDEGDLLELPPLVEETGIRPQPKPQPLVPEVVAPKAADPESKITVTKTVAESEIALTFPPELIEAIAEKVAEKISAKALTEVLPQLTELVVRKLAEENRESKR